jgi:hypothetical protein
MVYDTNAHLTTAQMNENAQFIAAFFIQHGWTKNAISGMIGNFAGESGCNFGIYESLNSGSSTNGFGLAQWTPNTKYFDWANANGYSGDHVNGELNRILYEVANNVQWIPGYKGYSYMTFAEFITSTNSPDDLASVWMYNYERPSDSSIASSEPGRRSNALNFYNTLDWSGAGGGVIEPPPPVFTPNNADIMHLLLSDCLNGWKW